MNFYLRSVRKCNNNTAVKSGLAYIDAQNLTRNNIGISIDGQKWIFTSRQKTDTDSNIPLLPMAEEILNKYSRHPQCLNEGRLLPILSNQISILKISITSLYPLPIGIDTPFTSTDSAV